MNVTIEETISTENISIVETLQTNTVLVDETIEVVTINVDEINEIITVNISETIESNLINIQEIVEVVTVELTETIEVVNVVAEELGIQGLKGDKGDKGDTSDKGDKGDNGTDATVTEIKVKEVLGITILSGINTGDQDLTPYQLKTNLFELYVNFVDVEIFYYTAPFTFKINSIVDADATGYTILLNDLPYTIGATITQYDKIKITVLTVGFLTLNSEAI